MSRSGSILIYGRHQALLETRRLLLENAGFTVTTAMESATITQLLSGPVFDLSLLCHTLSPSERSAMMSAAQQDRPGMKFVVMSADGHSQADGGRYSVVSVFDGPETLIDRVKTLLNEANAEAE